MTKPDDVLTEDEVAERVGTTVERVRELSDLGLLVPEQGMFRRRDVLRARVFIELTSMGIEASALAAAQAAGELSLGYLESAGRRHPRSDRTFEQVAADMNITFETFEAIYIAFGLPLPRRDELVRQEDLEGIRSLPVLLGAGVSEGQVLQMARVWGDSARRVAQYESHFTHAVIEEPFRQRGLKDNEAVEAAFREVGVRTGRSGEDLLGWLYRRHQETFSTEHQFAHVETALELAGVRARPAPGVEAAAFADLTGYTSLSEEAGDAAAADVSLALVPARQGDGFSTSRGGREDAGGRRPLPLPRSARRRPRLARRRPTGPSTRTSSRTRRRQCGADDLRRRGLLRPGGECRGEDRGSSASGSGLRR